MSIIRLGNNTDEFWDSFVLPPEYGSVEYLAKGYLYKGFVDSIRLVLEIWNKKHWQDSCVKMDFNKDDPYAPVLTLWGRCPDVQALLAICEWYQPLGLYTRIEWDTKYEDGVKKLAEMQSELLKMMGE